MRSLPSTLIVAFAVGLAAGQLSPPVGQPAPGTDAYKGWQRYCANGGDGQSQLNCYQNCGGDDIAVFCQDCCDNPQDCPCVDGQPDDDDGEDPGQDPLRDIVSPKIIH